MADNKFGVQFGGGFRYGWQPGMINDSNELTILRYTNPEAAEVYERLMAYWKRKREERRLNGNPHV